MNPFREMLNGAMPQSGRSIPIQLSPIAPMSGTDQVLADGNDSAVKLLNELAARKQAFEEMLKGRIDSPQMQMPNVQPNKNVALLGGLAALIGALTGDKYAVPAFGQLAGGLQQDAQAKAQRLLQEQQMKMQAQAQKDKAIGDLLGFQLEDAQNAYSRANAADAANRKAKAESEDAASKRAFEVWKTTTEQQGLTERARMGADARMAAINKSTDARKKYDEMVALGTAPEQALDVAYGIALYDEKVKGAQASTALSGARKDYTEAQTKYYPEKLAIDKTRAAADEWYKQQSLKIRQAAEARLAAGGGEKPSFKPQDDPSWFSLETRMKNLDLERMGHDSKINEYADALKQAEGFADSPEKPQLIQFYKDQIAIRSKRIREIDARRIAIRKDQLKRETDLFNAKQSAPSKRSGFSPMVPAVPVGIGTAPPSLSGSIGK